jgi:nicotinamidase/pyrazinamidase
LPPWVERDETVGSVERILLDVDTQRDFMHPDGALYVPDADRIIPNLVRLFDYARRVKVPVMSTADWHRPGDPEFDEFGPHCVAGSDGQAKIPETLLTQRVVIQPDEHVDHPERLLDNHEQIIFHKTTLDVWTNPNAVRFVESLEVGEYVAFGVATDYCVRAEVLGLLQRGRQVAVVGDAIRALAERTGRAAVAEMTAAGARWVTTDEVVGAQA